MQNEMAAIYQSALGLLARREHSALELSQKLCLRFPDQKLLISKVIDRLQQEGYQSDTRFIEVYLQSRLRKGFGRVRLAQELAAKGIARGEIAQALDSLDIAQVEHNILQLWQKKFGKLPKSPEEKHKQKQFLLYRGFPSVAIVELYKQLQPQD